MATTIRIEAEVRDRLATLAVRRYGAGLSLNDALDRLLTEAEGEQMVAAYATLQADPVAWADYTAELAEWDVVIVDGLSG